MTVALRSPNLLRALIPVDNAPVDANLKSDFHLYVRGLQDIGESLPVRQADADEILQKYEKESRAKILTWEADLTVALDLGHPSISSHKSCPLIQRRWSTIEDTDQSPGCKP